MRANGQKAGGAPPRGGLACCPTTQQRRAVAPLERVFVAGSCAIPPLARETSAVTAWTRMAPTATSAATPLPATGLLAIFIAGLLLVAVSAFRPDETTRPAV